MLQLIVTLLTSLDRAPNFRPIPTKSRDFLKRGQVCQAAGGECDSIALNLQLGCCCFAHAGNEFL